MKKNAAWFEKARLIVVSMRMTSSFTQNDEHVFAEFIIMTLDQFHHDDDDDDD